MAENSQGPSGRFARELMDRLADIRLRVDLGEISTASAFRAALEHGGRYALDDPRVRTACVKAGFGGWIE
jgi:hypothetical protein